MDNESVFVNKNDSPIVRHVKETWLVAHGYAYDGKGRSAEEILRDFTSALITGDVDGTAALEEKLADAEWNKEEAENKTVEANDRTDDLANKVEDLSIELINQLALVDKLAEKIGAAAPATADFLAELTEIMDYTRELVGDVAEAAKDARYGM